MCACCPWSTAASALTWTVPGISQSPCARWAAGWDGPERPSGRRWREGERAAGTNHLTGRKNLEACPLRPRAAIGGRDVKFYVHEQATSPSVEWFCAGLTRVLEAKGEVRVNEGGADVKLVLNLLNPQSPKPFRRKGQATF